MRVYSPNERTESHRTHAFCLASCRFAEASQQKTNEMDCDSQSFIVKCLTTRSREWRSWDRELRNAGNTIHWCLRMAWHNASKEDELKLSLHCFVTAKGTGGSTSRKNDRIVRSGWTVWPMWRLEILHKLCLAWLKNKKKKERKLSGTPFWLRKGGAYNVKQYLLRGLQAYIGASRNTGTVVHMQWNSITSATSRC